MEEYLIERVKNENIQETIGVTQDITKKIEKRKLAWCRHIKKTEGSQ